MDPTMLKIEFEALFEAHIDLDYTGFDTVEIENVLEITSTAPGEGEELDYGKLGVAQPAITRPGDSGAASDRRGSIASLAATRVMASS